MISAFHSDFWQRSNDFDPGVTALSHDRTRSARGEDTSVICLNSSSKVTKGTGADQSMFLPAEISSDPPRANGHRGCTLTDLGRVDG